MAKYKRRSRFFSVFPIHKLYRRKVVLSHREKLEKYHILNASEKDKKNSILKNFETEIFTELLKKFRNTYI